MRVILATSVAAACACAALLLPLGRPASAPVAIHRAVIHPADARPAAGPAHPAGPPPAAARHSAVRDAAAHPAPADGDAQGAVHSLALTALSPQDGPRAKGEPVPHGLTTRSVPPFSLLGVTWNDAGRDLSGTVQVRTRSRATGVWSAWQRLDDGEDRPDAGSPESRRAGARGGTAPLWVGDSDGVEVRAVPEAGADDTPEGRAAGAAALPAGLRVDLVTPGATPSGPASRATGDLPAGARTPAGGDRAGAAADDSWAPRPAIVTRAGWGADESLRESGFAYTDTVKAVFVHHTATSNDYDCADAPSIVRGIYRYHVTSEGWRDIGYNFLIDECGTIYEGRAGGVTRAVMGAHTLGFNTDTSGVALIGTFTKTKPPAAALTALERLAAWKLGLTGVDAGGHTTLVSGGSNKYAAGAQVHLWTISGHRDGFTTECPGAELYGELPAVRRAATALQGQD